jgi:transaldolase
MSDTASNRLDQTIREGISEVAHQAQANPHWTRLNEIGTELWLDTGDMDEAARLWSREYTALTTNNTLLNNEIQKGIYDQWILEAAKAAREDRSGLSDRELILEIAFALNARHGLRLVERFGAHVSVELHTDLAHDVPRSVAYGRRYHALCPDRFIVKVPLTAAGLVAARLLEEDGIRVNFTLGFSARQNVLITCVARPHYCNVFMGRLSAYAADENLGDGRWVGERATLASQNAVLRLRRELGVPTRQIGASMRSGAQAASLAGLDVYTMPLGVAEGFLADAPDLDSLQHRLGEDYVPTFHEGIDPKAEGLETLWQVSDAFEATCREIGSGDPASLSPEGILRALEGAGHGSVLPVLDAGRLKEIADAGKMPKRSAWQGELADGSVGLDALFTLAGLYAFSADQAALDERIAKQLG